MTTLTWTALTGGDWTTAASWSPSQSPTTSDTVLVTESGAYTVTVPSTVIVTLASMTLNNAFGEVDNSGILAFENGLTISAGTLRNLGGLNVYGEFSFAGTLINAGGLSLFGNYPAATLEAVQGLPGGGIAVYGAVDNTGGTLDPSSFPNQSFNFATIIGGTLMNWTTQPDNILDGVTYFGPLVLDGTIVNGLTLTGTSGTGPGTLLLPATGGVTFAGNQILDNATVSGGSQGGVIDAGGTLTLGSNLTVQVNYGPAGFEFPSVQFIGDTIINRSSILGEVTSSSSTILGYNSSAMLFAMNAFENTGVIAAIDSSMPGTPENPAYPGIASIDVSGASFVNDAGGLIELGESLGTSSLTVNAGVSFTNDGTILTQAPSSRVGGGVAIATFLGGTGTLEMGGGSQVNLQEAAASTQSLDFVGPATLNLATPATMPASINGFAPGDFIDIPVGVTGVSYSDGDLRLQVIGSSSTFDLAITGTYSLSDFNINAQGVATEISIACFATGTRLATTHGMVRVEALRKGDTVLLAHGGSMPIVWVGHRSVDCRRHPTPSAVWPVRVATGAFGAGLPQRDLYLSPDHAIFADGMLIPVKYLSNDMTIFRVSCDEVTYYHVELPRHNVVLAEGLPTESYLDTGDRASFENGGVTAMLHPDFASATWEAEGCAPLVVAGPKLECVRQRVNARAARLSIAA